MDKKLIIPIDIYNIDVEVFISEDLEKTAENIDKENNDKNYKLADNISGFMEGFSSICYQYKNGLITKRFIILIEEDVSDETVIHECLHTAWHVLEAKGIDLSHDNHESLAYLQGFLYKKIKNKLLKL